MADTIRAISAAVSEHGLVTVVAIVLMAGFVGIMTIHLIMLKKWGESNEKASKASEERLVRVEQRHDQVLVSNLTMQSAMIKLNESQDKKLDQLVKATENAAQKVSEQREETAKQTEALTSIKVDAAESVKLNKKLNDLLGSDPLRICRMSSFIKEQFPGMSDAEVAEVIRGHLEDKERRKAVEGDKPG